VRTLFSAKKNKPRERFYLLPGQKRSRLQAQAKGLPQVLDHRRRHRRGLVAGLMFLISK